MKMVSRKRKGSAAAAACSTGASDILAWVAKAASRSLRACASKARSCGFIESSPSGRCRGRKAGVDHGAATGQRHALHDVILGRQLRRPGLLVPEGGQEGQQVARVERRGGGGNARRPIVPAQDLHPV